jgi:hypothetical protein
VDLGADLAEDLSARRQSLSKVTVSFTSCQTNGLLAGAITTASESIR